MIGSQQGKRSLCAGAFLCVSAHSGLGGEGGTEIVLHLGVGQPGSHFEGG